jgi:hypothetical protein
MPNGITGLERVNLHSAHNWWPSTTQPQRQNQCCTSYAVIHCIVLLTMGILMPETCWDKDRWIHFVRGTSSGIITLPSNNYCFPLEEWLHKRASMFVVSTLLVLLNCSKVRLSQERSNLDTNSGMNIFSSTPVSFSLVSVFWNCVRTIFFFSELSFRYLGREYYLKPLYYPFHTPFNY